MNQYRENFTAEDGIDYKALGMVTDIFVLVACAVLCFSVLMGIFGKVSGGSNFGKSKFGSVLFPNDGTKSSAVVLFVVTMIAFPALGLSIYRTVFDAQHDFENSSGVVTVDIPTA